MEKIRFPFSETDQSMPGSTLPSFRLREPKRSPQSLAAYPLRAISTSSPPKSQWIRNPRAQNSDETPHRLRSEVWSRILETAKPSFREQSSDDLSRQRF